MRISLDIVRRWRLAGRGPIVPSPRYEVVCPCGHVATGERQEKHQAVTCAACGRKRFILPFSRLPPVRGADALAAPPEAGTRRAALFAQLRPWWLPLSAGGATLLVVIALFTLVLGHLSRQQGDRSAADAIARQVLAGQKALGLGKFHSAVKELEAAQKLRDQHPEALSLAERKQLNQLQRQAALLADLVPESIDDILRHAAEVTDLDEQEWHAHFAARYQGKAVVFDDEVRREAGGSHQLLGYRFFVRGQPARVDLGGVQLLRALPLDKPQRLLFGVRLAGVRVEAGTWVVHFEPDSGVLLSDAGATAACCPLPPDELRPLLERQATWAADLP